MPHIATPFVTGLLERVVLQRLPLLTVLYDCLSCGPTFTRHTGVCHTYPSPEDHTSYRSYRYSHSGSALENPYGVKFPASCPNCAEIYCWVGGTKGGGRDSAEASRVCGVCGHRYHIQRPADFQGYRNGWAVSTWADDSTYSV